MQNRPFAGLAEALASKVTVRDTVKLHPETVARAAEVAKAAKPKRKRKAATVKVKVSISVTVDPRIMAKAMELAGGDYTRLTIEEDGSVIVWNHPRTTKPQDNR